LGPVGHDVNKVYLQLLWKKSTGSGRRALRYANEIDVLNAPINIRSHVRDVEQLPKYVAKEVVEKIRKFRNLIHPARALKYSYDPRTFTREELQEFKDMYESVLHSLMYYL
jgi:hypothetical protein